jgi:hypothetical protein
VKSCAVSDTASLDELVKAGIVDTEFGRIAAAANLAWTVVSADDEMGLDQLISEASGRDPRHI